MTEEIQIDIKKELSRIKNKGKILSLRKKDTGIGYTLETEMGIKENNSRNHDFLYNGDLVEVKARRKNSSSKTTLFTKEPCLKILRDKLRLQKYGKDKNDRRAIYNTCKVGVTNSHDLSLRVNISEKKINLIDAEEKLLWQWVESDIKLKFVNLLVVYADTYKEMDKEYFLFNEAHYFRGFKEETFLKLIEKGTIVIDLRMHLKNNNTVRNHGTAFRMDINNKSIVRKKENESEKKYFELLKDCYIECNKII